MTVAPHALFVPADTRDFLVASQREPLNRFILSGLVRGLAAEGWTIEAGRPLDPLPPYGAARRKERALRLRHWWSVLVSNVGRVQFYNVYGVGPLDGLLLSARSLLRHRVERPVHADRTAAPSEAAHETALEAFERHDFGTRQNGERLLAILDELSSELLPSNFRERYDSNERAARRKATFTAPWVDTIVCGPALGGDDEAKFYMAWMAEKRGVRLVVNQHGGVYGLLETYSLVSQTDYRCADCFLSWGWRVQTGCDVDAVPASSPFLRQIRRRPAAERTVILVGTDVPSYNSRIDSSVFADDAAAYRADQISFAKTLSATAREGFSFRPYGRTVASERRYWDRHAPGTRFVSGDLATHLQRRAIVVVDHPGTTAFQTIAARIPTVLFWDPEIWRMCASARPALDALRGARVLHEHPIAAARHVNAVIGKVTEWWDAPATQGAVALFADQYCRSNRAWRSEWATLFADVRSPIYQARRVAR